MTKSKEATHVGMVTTHGRWGINGAPVLTRLRETAKSYLAPGGRRFTKDSACMSCAGRDKYGFTIFLDLSTVRPLTDADQWEYYNEIVKQNIEWLDDCAKQNTAAMINADKARKILDHAAQELVKAKAQAEQYRPKGDS